MASDWPTTTIGAQATLQRGFDITKAEQRGGTVPVISSSGISSYHDTPAARGPGVILGRKGVVGSVHYIESDYWPHDTSLWVKDFHGNHPRFVYYFFKWMAPRIATMDVGSANPTLNRNHVHPMAVKWPSPSEQRSIAHILGTLDDKIELNRRMNATMEAMARAVFQSWFVDFDPVRVRVSELITDGVLEIGDGYRAKNSELATEGLPFVRAGDLDTDFDLAGAERLSFSSVARATNKLSQPGDVAFTSKGTVGRIARVDAFLPQFVYAPQVCYWRSKSVTNLHPAVLYCWMKSPDFGNQILSRAGQTDMAPYISLKDQRGLTMPVFPQSHFETGDRLQLFLDLQAANTRQSRTLAAIRNALLPKLLSGELPTKKVSS